MILNRRSHHAGCPPPVRSSDVISEESDDYPPVEPRPRNEKGSASKRMSRIMSMALPSRIRARLFPDSSARKTIRASKISEPILINSTNISAPISKPHQRPASMYDPRSNRFSSYEDYNMVHLRTSAMLAGSPGANGVTNFF